ncbi:hypothetical protein CEP54_009788 [Fusarium duplospermum]|uniref:Heterokaryon incompatibility domain-containing protein n=1 Tax=Fusarium duplospermum TaxID=1325734 RepID=A0A428PNV1_9HYPO|nr:hypothetical protein CEP54_009788 [Fusarium duplospermum]
MPYEFNTGPTTGWRSVAVVTTPLREPLHGGFTYGRRLRHDTIDYALIHEWITQCKQSHDGACNDSTALSFDKTHFLLINCTGNPSEATIESGDDGGDSLKEYAALSYVWGQSNDQPMPRLYPGSRLPAPVPRVVTDAMTVVTRLGYRYLWVDRYCIPQDQTEASTAARHAQLGMMGRIYANAAITIIAAAGDGPDHGLPGVSLTNPRIEQPTLEFGDCLLTATVLPQQDIDDSRWATRGWTFQEGTLSCRRLIFTQRQTYFQCHNMQRVETLSGTIESFYWKSMFTEEHRGSMYTDGRRERSPTTLEETIVNYAGRAFMNDSDVLDAFRGILDRYASRREDQVSTFWGLPLYPTGKRVGEAINPLPGEGIHTCQALPPDTKAFALALTWEWECTLQLDRHLSFPSWTWLGWKRERPCLHHEVYGTFEQHALDPIITHILSISVKPTGNDLAASSLHRQRAEKGYPSLEVTGFLGILELEVERFEEKDTQVLPHFAGRQRASFPCLLMATGEDLNDYPEGRYDEACILVLKKLSGNDSYERLSCLSLGIGDNYEMKVTADTILITDWVFKRTRIFLE